MWKKIKKFFSKKKIPVYGNFCGPGHGDMSKKPINRLDSRCKEHDIDVGKSKNDKEREKVDKDFANDLRSDLKKRKIKNPFQRALAKIFISIFKR